jgi:hypothetical protein
VADAVWVEKSPAGHASFSGLLRCDSPWACPACAARLAAERAAELSRVVEEHGKDRAAMLTASLAHAKADDLKTLRTGMAAALKYVRTHREWRALAERYVLADARALEVQRGGFAGWHPHYHLLLLLTHVLDDGERAVVVETFARLWAEGVARSIGEAHRPGVHGVKLTACHDAGYLAKMNVGAELTDAGHAKSGKRGHLSPWEIADRAATGKAGYVALWREYQKAMRGAQALTGLKKLGELYAPIPRDNGAPRAEPVARIALADWEHVRRERGARLTILSMVEAGGTEADVDAFVERVVRERLNAMWRSRAEDETRQEPAS